MASNDRFKLEFGAEMLPAMMHAMAIARNTAMMDSAGLLKDRFQEMLDDLGRQCGVRDLSHLVQEKRWFAACLLLAQAKEYRWFAERSSWRGDEGKLTLVIDKRPVRLSYDFSTKTRDLDLVREILERQAHIDAVKLPEISDWRPYERYVAETAASPDDEAPAAPAP